MRFAAPCETSWKWPLAVSMAVVALVPLDSTYSHHTRARNVQKPEEVRGIREESKRAQDATASFEYMSGQAACLGTCCCRQYGGWWPPLHAAPPEGVTCHQARAACVAHHQFHPHRCQFVPAQGWPAQLPLWLREGPAAPQQATPSALHRATVGRGAHGRVCRSAGRRLHLTLCCWRR